MLTLLSIGKLARRVQHSKATTRSRNRTAGFAAVSYTVLRLHQGNRDQAAEENAQVKEHP